MNFRILMTAAVIGVFGLFVIIGTFHLPPVQSVQTGYRGTGMAQLFHPPALEATQAANRAPEVSPAIPPSGTLAGEQFKNVQVLKDIDANEFLRLMTEITAWVSPQQGCAYCHREGEDLSSDSLYTKIVSRRMIEMTRAINTRWKDHVGGTGVNCYTCHRGHPVPPYAWYGSAPESAGMSGAGNRAGQNIAAREVGYTSLPHDLGPLLSRPDEIRVVSPTALPNGSNRTIKQTEVTYGLMMHMSQALGVNCTFCHNSRSFTAWDQSSPQRVTSFAGIRMVQNINATYITPLSKVLPASRLAPDGEAPKVNCLTCHQGAYKPLFGANMIREYPALATGGVAKQGR